MKNIYDTPPLKSTYQPWPDGVRKDMSAVSGRVKDKIKGSFEKTRRNLTDFRIALGMTADMLTSGTFGFLDHNEQRFKDLLEDAGDNPEYEEGDNDSVLLLPRFEKRQEIRQKISDEWNRRSGWTIDNTIGKRDRRDNWGERLWRMRSVGYHAVKAYFEYEKDVAMGKYPVSLIDDEPARGYDSADDTKVSGDPDDT